MVLITLHSECAQQGLPVNWLIFSFQYPSVKHMHGYDDEKSCILPGTRLIQDFLFNRGQQQYFTADATAPLRKTVCSFGKYFPTP